MPYDPFGTLKASTVKQPKPKAMDSGTSPAALLIWGDTHASIKPKPPPAPRGPRPGDAEHKTQLPFFVMPQTRPAHRFLPEPAPSGWTGSNVYPHSAFGARTNERGELEGSFSSLRFPTDSVRSLRSTGSAAGGDSPPWPGRSCPTQHAASAAWRLAARPPELASARSPS